MLSLMTSSDWAGLIAVAFGIYLVYYATKIGV